MKENRRSFLRKTALGATASPFFLSGFAIPKEESESLAGYPLLDKVLAGTILKKELFPQPVIIGNIELLRLKDNFLCVVTSTDGARGISVSNNLQMVSLYPIFIHRIQPFFIGKNAVELDLLIEQVYTHHSNYKLQGLALWVPLATLELAILDLLGRIADKPLGALIGDIHNSEIAVYQATNYRGLSAAESIQHIIRNVEETNARAVKFKIGGRMSNNADFPPGRSEELIPLIRKTFGDKMTIYADANGSYTVDEAIRIGKILEEFRIDFYEEPVPFDWYEETKEVTKALKIPVAGGEQEPSMHNFRWLIANDALDIVQPDIFYFGGFIRSLKVARMAEAKNKLCIPHISGSGLGYLYMMHFVSVLPNAGPYHEFKVFSDEIPITCNSSDLRSNNGVITLPSGPGLGVEIDPDFIAKHKPVQV